MDNKRGSQTVAGGLFIVLGLILLGAQADWWSIGRLLRWWPLGIVAVGISRGALTRDGFTWIGYGALLLVWSLGVWPLRESWPLLLVVHGAALVLWPSTRCGAGRDEPRVG